MKILQFFLKIEDEFEISLKKYTFLMSVACKVFPSSKKTKVGINFKVKKQGSTHPLQLGERKFFL